MVKLTTEKILRSVPGWKKNQHDSTQKFLRKLTHLHLEEKELTEVIIFAFNQQALGKGLLTNIKNTLKIKQLIIDGTLLKTCSSLVVLYLFDNSLTHVPALCSCCSLNRTVSYTDDVSSQETSDGSLNDREITSLSDTTSSLTLNEQYSSITLETDTSSLGTVGGANRKGGGVKCYTPRLSMLYLQNNLICQIEHLHALSNLTKLYIGGNSISVLEGLEGLTQLQELHVENQRLEEGENLCIDQRSIRAIASTLLILNISGNNLTSLGDLQPLSRLTDLMASNNCLSDLDLLIEDIEVMTSLSRVDLSGNPVCSAAKYRDRIILATPHIEHLDNKPVTETSRRFLQNWHASRITAANKKAQGRSQHLNLTNGIPDMNYTGDYESGPRTTIAAGDAGHYMPGLPPSRYTFKIVSRSTSDKSLPNPSNLSLPPPNNSNNRNYRAMDPRPFYNSLAPEPMEPSSPDSEDIYATLPRISRAKSLIASGSAAWSSSAANSGRDLSFRNTAKIGGSRSANVVGVKSFNDRNNDDDGYAAVFPRATKSLAQDPNSVIPDRFWE